MSCILEAKNLTKSYKKEIVINGVNLSLKEGEVLGIIGENGAGKTTLLKMITGMLQPDGGDIMLFGGTVNNNSAYVGSLIDGPSVFGYMTAYGNMEYYGRLFDCYDGDRFDELLDIVGLLEYKNKKVSKFSTGMKQRLGIAIALLGDVRLVLLDEPFNGIDATGSKELESLILDIAKKNISVIISGHVISNLLSVCDRYMIMKQGEVACEITSKEISSNTNNDDDAEQYIIEKLGGALL